MEGNWFILTTRFGSDIRSPSEAQLRAALDEVFIENHPKMTKGDYEEHPNAFLRFGKDSGPMFVVYVNREREVVFEQWADADYETELAPPGRLTSVSFGQAVELWSSARQADVTALQRHPWLPV